METFCPVRRGSRAEGLDNQQIEAWHESCLLTLVRGFSLHPYDGNTNMPVQHNHQGKLVLVVEDDPDMRSLLCDVVHELGLQVAEATDGNGAIQQIGDVEPHVVLTDLRIPAGGFEYVRTIRALYPSRPIILLTAFGDHHAKAEALACGVRAFFAKPVRLVDLQRAIIGILDGEWEPSD
jgi:CheY-like chemotaxis protein